MVIYPVSAEELIEGAEGADEIKKILFDGRRKNGFYQFPTHKVEQEDLRNGLSRADAVRKHA